MQHPQDLVGKVAVVAGGSLGIGAGASVRLAQGGAKVVLCGRREGPVRDLVARLRKMGHEADGMPADVSTPDGAKALIDHAVATFGAVDILVNSQGIQRYGTVVDTPEETWDEVFDVNVKSMYLTSQAAIPEMRKRGGGAIVHVSSVQGLANQKRVAAYAASKGAINALTRAMAYDHAAENIRVTSVLPASIDTPMLRHAADMFKGNKSMDDILNDWGNMHPIGRIGTPEEVGELIAFLVSDRAAFITGGEYKIDGGMMAALGVSLPEV